MDRLGFSLLVLVPLLVWDPMPVSGAWKTLSGRAPVVIANGGTSGLYPDQTLMAYQDALNYSLPGVIISCDLQLAKCLAEQCISTGTGICRTGLDLSNSTKIQTEAPNLNTTHVVDGVNTTGWFAIDIPYENLTVLAGAAQSNQARTDVFDGLYRILKPEEMQTILNMSAAPTNNWWLNSEYTTFIDANSKFNATLFTIEAVQQLNPGYVSAPEISLLKEIQAAPNTTGTKSIYKFLDTAASDASTNQSYRSLLHNLTYIKTFASGILVPKGYIWPVDNSSLYLLPPNNTLVQGAHNVGLEVYAYGFANDQYPNSYNYTFDPITELLYYIENAYNFSVDGVFTDFPTTASEAISCYALSSRNNSVQSKASPGKQKTVVISHNGDSGKYPGATTPAYYGAIDAGVEYIDCSVQITSDSVPICRQTINLVETTDVTQSDLFQTYYNSYPGFNNDASGVYTFELTWAEISTLTSIQLPRQPEYDYVYRDPNYNNQYGILTLVEVLEIAKNNSVGALIDIQNAVYLRDAWNLSVVDAVVDALSTAGYNGSDRVILQSEDSSVLARFQVLKVPYPLMYEVTTYMVSLNASDFIQIKEFATAVNLHRRLLFPFDSTNYFLIGPPNNLITLAHDQNLTVYAQVQQDEFVTMPFDLRADPTLQLFDWIHYGIDGVITDFPTTVTNYLNSTCSGFGLQSGTVNFSIPLVVPGVLSSEVAPVPPGQPPPNLVVPEAPLAGLPSPTPAPSPAAASHLSICLLVSAFSFVLHLVAIL